MILGAAKNKYTSRYILVFCFPSPNLLKNGISLVQVSNWPDLIWKVSKGSFLLQRDWVASRVFPES